MNEKQKPQWSLWRSLLVVLLVCLGVALYIPTSQAQTIEEGGVKWEVQIAQGVQEQKPTTYADAASINVEPLKQQELFYAYLQLHYTNGSGEVLNNAKITLNMPQAGDPTYYAEATYVNPPIGWIVKPNTPTGDEGGSFFLEGFTFDASTRQLTWTATGHIAKGASGTVYVKIPMRKPFTELGSFKYTPTLSFDRVLGDQNTAFNLTTSEVTLTLNGTKDSLAFSMYRLNTNTSNTDDPSYGDLGFIPSDDASFYYHKYKVTTALSVQKDQAFDSANISVKLTLPAGAEVVSVDKDMTWQDGVIMINPYKPEILNDRFFVLRFRKNDTINFPKGAQTPIYIYGQVYGRHLGGARESDFIGEKKPLTHSLGPSTPTPMETLGTMELVRKPDSRFSSEAIGLASTPFPSGKYVIRRDSGTGVADYIRFDFADVVWAQGGTEKSDPSYGINMIALSDIKWSGQPNPDKEVYAIVWVKFAATDEWTSVKRFSQQDIEAAAGGMLDAGNDTLMVNGKKAYPYAYNPPNGKRAKILNVVVYNAPAGTTLGVYVNGHVGPVTGTSGLRFKSSFSGWGVPPSPPDNPGKSTEMKGSGSSDVTSQIISGTKFKPEFSLQRTTGSTVNPGGSDIWRLTASFTDSATQAFRNPQFSVLLPPGYSVDNDPAYKDNTSEYDRYNVGVYNLPDGILTQQLPEIKVAPNHNGLGRTLVTIKYKGVLQRHETLTGDLKVNVAPTVAIGNHQVDAWLSADNDGFKYENLDSVDRKYISRDTFNILEKGTSQGLYHFPLDSTITRGRDTLLFTTAKGIYDLGDYTTNANADKNSKVDGRLTLNYNSPTPLTKIKLISKLPYPLIKAVHTSNYPGTEVFYHTSATDAPPANPAASGWTKDFTNALSIYVIMPEDYQLVRGGKESIEIPLVMQVPADGVPGLLPVVAYAKIGLETADETKLPGAHSTIKIRGAEDQIVVEKTANPVRIVPTGEVLYTVQVVNTKATEADNWSIVDTMPERDDNFTLVPGSATITIDGQELHLGEQDIKHETKDEMIFSFKATDNPAYLLPSGKTATLTYKLKATAASREETYINMAEVKFGDTLVGNGSADVVIKSDVFKKNVVGTGIIKPGGTVDYTLTFEADADYESYRVVDSMTDRDKYFKWVNGYGTVTRNGVDEILLMPSFGDIMTFTDGKALKKNDTVTIRYILQAKDTLPAGTYTNTAVTWLENTEMTPASSVDVVVPITKTANPASIQPGQTVTYTVTVANTSKEAATNWEVWSIEDSISSPDQFEWVSGTIQINGVPGTFPVDRPESLREIKVRGPADLPAGSTAVLEYQLKAKADTTPFTYGNTATLFVNDRKEGEDGAEVTVTPKPITKLVNQPIIVPSGEATFTVKFSNTTDNTVNWLLEDTMDRRAANFDVVSKTIIVDEGDVVGQTETDDGIKVVGDTISVSGTGLPPGKTGTLEYTLKATGAAEATPYTNRATVTFEGESPVSADERITVGPHPITKKVAGNNTTTINPGERVIYTVTLKSDDTYTGFEITDYMRGRKDNFILVSEAIEVDGAPAINPSKKVIDDEIIFTGDDILSENTVVTINYTLQAKDTITAAKYSNEATAVLKGKRFTTPSVTIGIPITKTADPASIAAQTGTVTYTISVMNTTTTAANYSIVDTMPERSANFEWVKDSGHIIMPDGRTIIDNPIDLSAPPNVINIAIGELAAGEKAEVTYQLKAKETNNPETQYTNTAILKSGDTEIGKATAKVTVKNHLITKQVDKQTINPGGTVIYTVTLTADHSYSNFAITDSMPDRDKYFEISNINISKSQATTTIDQVTSDQPDTMIFKGTDLNDGSSITIEYTLKAKDNIIASKYSNKAEVVINGDIDNPIITSPVDITVPITKTASPTSISQIETVTYTINVVNNTTATVNYTITDTMDDRSTNFEWVKDSGQIIMPNDMPLDFPDMTDLSRPFTFTIRDLPAGEKAKVIYKLKAKAGSELKPYTNEAILKVGDKEIGKGEAKVTVTPNPLQKSVEGETTIGPGDAVTYKLTLKPEDSYTSYSVSDSMKGRDTNFHLVGNVSIKINDVADALANIPPLADSMLFTSASPVGPGDVVLIEYTLKAKATIAPDKYSNKAIATLVGAGGSTTTPETPDVDVSVPIRKTADSTSIQPGKEVTYEVTVANTGTEDAAEWKIEDFMKDREQAFTWKPGSAKLSIDGGDWNNLIDPVYGDTIIFSFTDKIAAGKKAVLSYQLKARDDIPIGSYTNTATLLIKGEPVGKDGEKVTVEPTLALVISGTVFDDHDANGVWDSKIDKPMPGITVTLKDSSNAVVDTTTTDDQGFYSLSLNADGSYTLEVDMTDKLNEGWTETTPYPANDSAISTLAVTLAGVNIDNNNFGYNLQALLLINKKAGVSTARVGELVPYVITIENISDKAVAHVLIEDLIPAGFKYVAGSARLDKVKIADPTDTRPVHFDIGTVKPGQKMTLTYFLVVGAGVQPGEYRNLAVGKVADKEVSNKSTIGVTIISDPLFDDSLIFGKVFHDKNKDGYQDNDEPGISGAKLVTVRGEVITTDQYGRYHITDVNGGRWERGANFILKLDMRSLPSGATLTTDNPVVARVSPGLPSRIDFGVLVP